MVEKEAQAVVETLVKFLRERKVPSYEIFYSSDEGTGVEVKDGKVEALKKRSNRGVGLRAIKGGRIGFGSTSVLTEDSLEDLVHNALSSMAQVDEDRFYTLPEPMKEEEADLDTFDDDFWNASPDDLIRAARSIEEGARAEDPRVRKVRKASYDESVKHMRVVSSKGVDVSSKATFFSGSVTAVAEEGGEQEMGWEVSMAHRRRLIETHKTGSIAARNALRLLGAKRIPTVKCPAVIENTVVCELLEALAGSFLADNVHKGKSMLKDKVGRKVTSGLLSVFDNGILHRGWSSSLYDGEGVPRRKTPLLLEGVLQGFLYDTYWAGRSGVASTGNASRYHYKSLPAVGISNLYMDAGAGKLEDLFERMGKGFFVTDVLGVHTINTVTGEFSLGAAGLWVEGGVPSSPVRGMAIAGNLLDLFSRAAALAGDLRFIGNVGAPSILVSEIEVSGA